MVSHIEENIYSILVPLPENPLRNLNAYVIRDARRNLLIDTGFRREACRQALVGGLAELGVSMDNTDIFLTHLHADHCGMAPELAGPDSRIFISAPDGDRLERAERGSGDELKQSFASYGFSARELDFISDMPSRKYLDRRRTVYSRLRDGDTLEYGGRRLRVIYTPGHTPGHACLYDAESALMFLGDHVLFDITPNITTWPDFEDPLGRYVHSLLDISTYDVRLPLPAHRTVSCPMAERVGTIIEHHGVRIREMLDRLETHPGISAYALSGLMSWHVRGRSPDWADFPLQQKWFAVGETAAHLEYLLLRGRVRRELRDGVWYFSLD